MHPVEEDSRFAIQPVYPDRQTLCAEGEEHGKRQPSPLRSGRAVACRFRPASTIFRKLGPNVAKERAGVVFDHPNDPRVTQDMFDRVFPPRQNFTTYDIIQGASRIVKRCNQKTNSSIHYSIFSPGRRLPYWLVEQSNQ
jgi:hypothetical protein